MRIDGRDPIVVRLCNAVVLILTLLLMLAFMYAHMHGQSQEAFTSPRTPNATLTPGEADPRVTAAMVCTPGYSARVRNVPSSVKRAVYRRYGVTPSTHDAVSAKGNRYHASDYEVDHLISLELGGTNDVRNLWPQSYVGPWNAHDKDAVEDSLHARVCAGTLTLQQAQHDIATDWEGAYRQFVDARGPLDARTDVHIDKW